MHPRHYYAFSTARSSVAHATVLLLLLSFYYQYRLTFLTFPSHALVFFVLQFSCSPVSASCGLSALALQHSELPCFDCCRWSGKQRSDSGCLHHTCVFANHGDQTECSHAFALSASRIASQEVSATHSNRRRGIPKVLLQLVPGYSFE